MMKLFMIIAAILLAAQLSSADQAVSMTDLLNRDTISIDPKIDGLSILAVSGKENADGLTDAMQTTRAYNLCKRFGFSKPIASQISWEDGAGQVLSLDNEGNFITISVQIYWIRYQEGYGRSQVNYRYAIFKSLRCQK